jgi:hypothetical protein
VVQPGSLGREMAGDLGIKPVLDLGSQIKDFDGHGGIPVNIQHPASADSGATDMNLGFGDTTDMGVLLTDFNICHSITRDLERFN